MRTFSIIVIAFYICMLPNSILMTYHTYSYVFNTGKRIDTTINYTMNFTFLCLQNINSCLNPLIYAKMHRKIYAALKRAWNYLATCMFQTCTTSQQSEPHSIEIWEGARKRESVDSQFSNGGETVESRLWDKIAPHTQELRSIEVNESKRERNRESSISNMHWMIWMPC